MLSTASVATQPDFHACLTLDSFFAALVGTSSSALLYSAWCCEVGGCSLLLQSQGLVCWLGASAMSHSAFGTAWMVWPGPPSRTVREEHEAHTAVSELVRGCHVGFQPRLADDEATERLEGRSRRVPARLDHTHIGASRALQVGFRHRGSPK